MKKIKLFPLLLLICLLCSVLSPAALALDDPEVSSAFIVLADADSGRIYFSKNMDAKAYPASLTKVMTVLLAMEAVERGDASLYDEVTMTATALQGMVEEGSTAGIVEGEIMSLEDLFYCALVESANEACNAIAEHIGGSISNFVSMMNQRATELGCTGTHFANTHGLPDTDHYTTAYDMYLITMEATSKDLFMEICNTVKHTVPATNMSPVRELSNTNGLINAESPYYRGYYYEYAKGVKTGHTTAAGYCLISTAERDDIKLVAVVMGGQGYANQDGSNTYENFRDSIALYNWIFNNFTLQEVLSSSDLVAEVPVTMGADGDSVTLRPKDVITVLLPNEEKVSDFTREKIIYSQRDGEELKAPIAAGQVLGEITVSKDGVVYGSTPLVASTSVELSKLQYMKSQIGSALDLVWVKIIFWVLMIVLVAYALLVVRYRILHKRHQQKLRRARLEREQRREQDQSTRVFSQSAAQRPSGERTPPKVDYFTEAEVKARQTVKISSNSPDMSAEKRDYFEEFFRRRGEQGSDSDKKE